MNIKQALIHVLMNWLPADEQARMVDDFIACLYADLPPGEQQEKIERLRPRLVEMVREGRLGPWMLTYHYFLRLPALRWLDRRAVPVETRPEGKPAPLASH
jgi:hypothetical protein